MLIVEQVLPDGDASEVMPALTDIAMLVLNGSQERNAAEYGVLLEEAGFTNLAVRATSGQWTVVEATKS